MLIYSASKTLISANVMRKIDFHSFCCIIALNDIQIDIQFSFYMIVFLPVVFIYSMPGYKCSVRERMLYSTCKAPLLAGLEDQLKLEIVKKVNQNWVT